MPFLPKIIRWIKWKIDKFVYLVSQKYLDLITPETITIDFSEHDYATIKDSFDRINVRHDDEKSIEYIKKFAKKRAWWKISDRIIEENFKLRVDILENVFFKWSYKKPVKKEKQEETLPDAPMSSYIAYYEEKVWMPYKFRWEKYSFDELNDIIEWHIFNSRAWTEEWDKKNRQLVMKMSQWSKSVDETVERVERWQENTRQYMREMLAWMKTSLENNKSE